MAQTEDCSAYAQSGEEHKHLARLAGTWHASVTQWFGPGEPTRAEGTMVTRMIHNGLYLEQRYESEMNGMKFTGVGISGFNLAANRYENFWCDSMGSGMMISYGQYDPDTRQFRASGTMPSPQGDGELRFRDVNTIKSDNEHVMEMYMQMPGQPEEMKVMEIVFTRK